MSVLKPFSIFEPEIKETPNLHTELLFCSLSLLNPCLQPQETFILNSYRVKYICITGAYHSWYDCYFSWPLVCCCSPLLHSVLCTLLSWTLDSKVCCVDYCLEVEPRPFVPNKVLLRCDIHAINPNARTTMHVVIFPCMLCFAVVMIVVTFPCVLVIYFMLLFFSILVYI